MTGVDQMIGIKVQRGLGTWLIPVLVNDDKVRKDLNPILSLLRSFLCFTTNQFAQKLNVFANFITYLVNMCNIY